MSTPTRGLGRGLESLIPTQPVKSNGSSTRTDVVSISKIKTSRYQPRIRFNEENIKELAESIKTQGLIQPLIVTTHGDSGYELIAGERRLRAAKLAGLTEVPIVVKKVTEREQLQMALVENLQREDLNPIEEANAYKRLMEEFTLTQEELSKAIGKGRVVIANTLRLLNLPNKLQDAVSDGTISAGHARNLVSLNDQKMQEAVAERVLNENLTVRDVEKIVSDWKSAITQGQVKLKKDRDPNIRTLEESLQRTLGNKVEIKTEGQGANTKGTIKISYYSLEDLERIVKLLGQNPTP